MSSRASATIVIALFISAPLVHAQPRIGTVDVSRVVKEYSKTKEAQARITEAQNAAKQEFSARADAYKKALDELNKLGAQLEAPALAAQAKAAKTKERDEKIAAIRSMERDITEFRSTREQQLQQQVLRLREGILKEITAVVMERVKANNIDLVFDTSGPSGHGFSPVLFARENFDFTAEVIAALQRSATPSPRPAAP